jgi:hypothetical protein
MLFRFREQQAADLGIIDAGRTRYDAHATCATPRDIPPTRDMDRIRKLTWRNYGFIGDRRLSQIRIQSRAVRNGEGRW